MAHIEFELKEPVEITGNGTSLWCKDSAGVFTVNEMRVRNCHGSDEPYELRLHGPSTRWDHYTDEGIENDVDRIFKPIVQRMYPTYVITSIEWSEQGMQPDDGWSFDINSQPVSKD